MITKEPISQTPGKCTRYALGSEDEKIVLGSSWYKVEADMFFSKLLTTYNRPYLAGPSGSAVLAYILVFVLLKFERNEQNHMLLLSCITADYVPYYHTITEILLTYTYEVDIKPRKISNADLK